MADLRIKIENAEIRGVDPKEGRVNKETGEKGAPFLIVRIDDDAGVRHELIDRDMENEDVYRKHKGVICEIAALLKYGYGKGGGWARLEIKGFKPRKDGKEGE